MASELKVVELIAQPVLMAKAALGEGAIWDSQKGVLNWIDIDGFTVNTFDPQSRKNTVIKLPTHVGTVVKRKQGGFLVGMGREFAHVDEAGKISVLAQLDEPETNRLNDGKCDPAGRFWCGSMAFDFKPGAGKLYMMDLDHSVQVKVDAVTISNGIVWTADASTMYYIDTKSGHIDAFDYDIATGAITNRRIAVKNSWDGYFDGMTIDTEDNVYVAMWEGSCVLKINPKTAELLAKINVPGALNITSCAFGGADLRDLYITSAIASADAAKYPNSGDLFKITVPDAQGLPAFEYGG